MKSNLFSSNHEKELVPAKLNNKDLMDELIYYDVFDDNYVERNLPNNGHDVIGFFFDNVLRAMWSSDSNKIAFSFVESTDVSNIDNVVDELKKRLQIQSENGDIKVNFHREKNLLLCEFFFEVEQ